MKIDSMIRSMAATVAFAAVASVAAIAQPKMEIVGGDTYDWGKVKSSPLTTVVQVKNTGNADLKIGDVRPGCGCTAAPIDKNLLKPGEVGKISITIKVPGHSGPIEKIVTIYSNDSTNTAHVLHLKADLHPVITCTPAQYMLVTNASLNTESAASPMTIKNTGETPITIQKPTLADGGNIGVRFDMNGPQTLKPGEEYVLKAFVTPKNAASITGTLNVKTSSSDMPAFDITVSGTMNQPSVSPRSAVAPPAMATPPSATQSGTKTTPH
ncbi:MAG TPA: DUF1573 domain-containing protein [Candidatus Kapabacteria bacterium]|nr:DUF1573 domain-containing protein [Candidatus Kapabacteria bacterium]